MRSLLSLPVAAKDFDKKIVMDKCTSAVDIVVGCDVGVTMPNEVTKRKGSVVRVVENITWMVLKIS